MRHVALDFLHMSRGIRREIFLSVKYLNYAFASVRKLSMYVSFFRYHRTSGVVMKFWVIEIYAVMA